MPDTITLTIRIVDNGLKVVDQDGKEQNFEAGPGDNIIWRADPPVGQWSVGFPDMNKVPFTGNKRYFSGSTHTTDTGRTRHAPEEYYFWVFAQLTDAPGQALYVDPKLIIRSGLITREAVSTQAANLKEATAQLRQAAEVADAAYLDLLALERQLDVVSRTRA